MARLYTSDAGVAQYTGCSGLERNRTLVLASGAVQDDRVRGKVGERGSVHGSTRFARYMYKVDVKTSKDGQSANRLTPVYALRPLVAAGGEQARGEQLKPKSVMATSTSNVVSPLHKMFFAWRSLSRRGWRFDWGVNSRAWCGGTYM